MARTPVMADTGAAWWLGLPERRVTHVTGPAGDPVDPDLLDVSLDPLPESAPAVLRYHPSTGATLGEQVRVLLDELDHAATALFPAWLPGADRLAGPQGLGVPAVRALAADLAARSADFGPFLADLAERSLRRRPDSGSRFPSEVRAQGLVRVLERAYARPYAALLVDVPEGLTPVGERTLVAAAEWFANYGRASVWLAGARLRTDDRVRTVAITLPASLTELAAEVVAPPRDPIPARPVLIYPALSGVPRSATERALEQAFQRHDWSAGRHWNYRYARGPLSLVYRLDVYWPTEGVVVEVDGPEHRGAVKFAADHHRDNALTIDGLRVLRFVNERIHTDLGAVLHEIETLLTHRRTSGKRHHGDH